MDQAGGLMERRPVLEPDPLPSPHAHQKWQSLCSPLLRTLTVPWTPQPAESRSNPEPLDLCPHGPAPATPTQGPVTGVTQASLVHSAVLSAREPDPERQETNERQATNSPAETGSLLCKGSTCGKYFSFPLSPLTRSPPSSLTCLCPSSGSLLP